jgi:hypothetical protein
MLQSQPNIPVTIEKQLIMYYIYINNHTLHDEIDALSSKNIIYRPFEVAYQQPMNILRVLN